ncbi:hypothetical protein PCS_02601 [Desulfocurvibacter africanus PCS]|uniref:Uncharacterized protein n=1 Tax=Desulfocurvibacter africanus PCS TaxID=1262666 RepID=M5PR42_DESAF|nr:hypothetical protein [Desulfocurvibacter africanus]EMG36589.1 hypothetical protein PCS_02601 [Desulfocurvibacter africanus PCS]
MLISRKEDLLNAALALADGTISPSDINFAEYITDVIKIDSDYWGTAKVIDHKTAQLILAIQKDVLGLYNDIYSTSIGLKDLDAHPFLVVKFSIEDGCIQIFSSISKQFFNFCDGMTPRQRLIALLAAAAIVASVSCAVLAYFADKNRDILEKVGALEETQKIASRHQETQRVVINNIGDGTVVIGGGTHLTGKELKEMFNPAKPKKDNPPIDIDDHFIVLKYDFDGQKIFLAHRSGTAFWASTEWLSGEQREQLKAISAKAIDQSAAITAQLNVTGHIKEARVERAVVLGVGRPARQTSVKLGDALTKQVESPSRTPEPEQLSFDFESDESGPSPI